MLLREKNLNFDLKEERPGEKRDAFLAINPAGDVPVLVEDSGLVVCDGYPITEYLEEAYQQINFIGATAGEHAEVRRIMSWFDFKFYNEVTRPLLHERYFSRFEQRSQVNPDIIRKAKQHIRFHLDYTEYLISRRGWLAGERITLADMSAAGQISSLDYFEDIPWPDFPAVKEWYSIMKSRPSLRAILVDRVSHSKPPSYYEDPDF